ncbi:hypothetical protein Tco_0498796 [Tanacetum coccineum]
MAYEIKLMFTLLVIVGLMQVQTLVVGEPQVPCYFIFGDALVDSGNINKLVAAGKASYLPYGIDFPQSVTGFPNFIPPYALATDQQISTCVNYGSAYAGIREETRRIETLYNLGARKIAVYGLGWIGLKPVVDMLNSDFSDARFTFINLTNIQATQGGEVLPNVTCCQVRPSDGQCIPNSIPCPV